MRKSLTQKVALSGMLFALAIAFSMFESLITSWLGLFPGVKLGLANVVVMFALLFLGKGQAALLVVLKAGFSMMTRGVIAGILSLTGGLVSLLLMLLLLMPKRKPSLFLLSIAGALGHNMGQFIAVRFILGPAFTYYFPVLLISGVIMGVLTSLVLRVLMPALQKIGFKPIMNL